MYALWADYDARPANRISSLPPDVCQMSLTSDARLSPPGAAAHEQLSCSDYMLSLFCLSKALLDLRDAYLRRSQDPVSNHPSLLGDLDDLSGSPLPAALLRRRNLLRDLERRLV